MQRIFSGIQPTGIPTLGNYLGAMRNWVALQDDHDCIYCVVDLHAITVPHDPKTLAQADARNGGGAAGLRHRPEALDPVPPIGRHARMLRLAWIFECVARIGWLNRMTQFKDKAGKDRENVSAGLYTYPDPDGGRHPGLSRDPRAGRRRPAPAPRTGQRHRPEVQLRLLRRRDFFPLIEPLILGPAARVMSLRDGTKKMSKSDPSDQSRINLNDDADTIALKIRRAKTDPEPLPSRAGGAGGAAGGAQPGRHLRRLAGHRPSPRVLRDHGGQGFGAFKDALADCWWTKLAPIAAEMRRLLGDPATIDAILRDGAERAAAIADPIVRRPSGWSAS